MLEAEVDNFDRMELFRTEVFTFWTERGTWPIENSEYIFLGRAIDATGKTLHGDKWSGDETAQQVLPNLSTDGRDLFDINIGWGQRYVRNLFQRYAPDQEADGPPWTLDQSITARELFEKYEIEKRVHALSRLNDVIDQLLRGLVDGKVESFVQHIDGGQPYEPLQKLSWTKASARTWFLTCLYDEEPLTAATHRAFTQEDEELPSFIFLSRSSLEDFLSQIISVSRNTRVGPPNRESESSSIEWNYFDELPDFSGDRELLIQRVESGAMFLPEAEAEAERLGLQPIQNIPEISSLGIMSVPEWSIEMTLAWIIWRRVEEVAFFTPEYHAAISYPSQPFGEIPPLSLQGIKGRVEFLNSIGETSNNYSASLEDLRRSLSSGDLVADGMNLRTKRPSSIPANEWRYLGIIHSHNGTELAFNQDGPAEYAEITLVRDAVINRWKPTCLLGGPTDPKEGIEGPVRVMSQARLVRLIKGAVEFAETENLRVLTKEEATEILCDVPYCAVRTRVRDAMKEAGLRATRGPTSGSRKDRTEDLDKFRRFFASAELRK